MVEVVESAAHSAPQIVEQLSNLIKEQPEFDQYRETDEYKIYFELIKIENENMSDYLINMAIFGYWFQENRENIIDKEIPKDIPKSAKGDIPDCINVFNSFDEYLILNPNVKVIGEDLKIISD